MGEFPFQKQTVTQTKTTNTTIKGPDSGGYSAWWRCSCAKKDQAQLTEATKHLVLLNKLTIYFSQ